MAKFPASPSYTGFHAPSRLEADILDLEIEGEVPKVPSTATPSIGSLPTRSCPRGWVMTSGSTATA